MLLRNFFLHIEIYIFSWIFSLFVYIIFVLQNNVLNVFIEMCLMRKEKKY